MSRSERVLIAAMLFMASPALAEAGGQLCDREEAGCRFFLGLIVLALSIAHPFFIAAHAAVIAVWAIVVKATALRASVVAVLIFAGAIVHAAALLAALLSTMFELVAPFTQAGIGYVVGAVLAIVVIDRLNKADDAHIATVADGRKDVVSVRRR